MVEGPNTWKESQKLLEGKGSIEFLLSLTQTKRNGSILVRVREAVFSQSYDPWSALMCPGSSPNSTLDVGRDCLFSTVL